MKPHQNTDKSLVQNEAKGSTKSGKKTVRNNSRVSVVDEVNRVWFGND